jgi:hypothetical protein
MIDEIKLFLPEGVATEVFEISLHNRPEILRAKLQEAIDASDGIYDRVWAVRQGGRRVDGQEVALGSAEE